MSPFALLREGERERLATVGVGKGKGVGLWAGRGVQAGEVETPAMAAEARRERRQGVEGEERRATHSRERRQQESAADCPSRV